MYIYARTYVRVRLSQSNSIAKENKTITVPVVNGLNMDKLEGGAIMSKSGKELRGRLLIAQFINRYICMYVCVKDVGLLSYSHTHAHIQHIINGDLVFATARMKKSTFLQTHTLAHTHILRLTESERQACLIGILIRM